MKIGIDARPLSYPKTGIAVYLHHLLDSMQSHDHENRYYLISNAPIEYKIHNPNWHQVAGNLKRKSASTLWMQFYAPLIMNQNRIELFWSPRHHLPVRIPKTVRSVVTIHDLVHRICPRTMPLTHLLADRFLMGHAVRTATRIITVSHSTSDALRKAYGVNNDKVRIIYHGVPRLNPSPRQPSAPPYRYFLFVGTLEPRKNIELIISAFLSVLGTYPEIHLVIIGQKGWKNKNLLNWITSPQLRHRIHYKGDLPHHELSAIYSNAVCLLFPSIYEGFGFPILEAMSMGIPVITSDKPAMNEIAQDAALLVDPHHVNSITSAMLAVLTRPEVRAQLISKGLKRAGRFSWQTCCFQTLKVFQEAVNL
ncbi:MAG: glycosyltransferase family 1 protein [Thermodesulfobacteriota bacterium]